MDSNDSTTLSVRILDREYLVSCPPEARADLEKAAQHLDRKMREIKRTGKVIGIERIAVMAALNLSHDLLKTSDSEMFGKAITRLNDKLDDVLKPKPSLKA